MWSTRVKLKLGRELGCGEQGRVFEGLRVDPATGLRQVVAVKVLHSGTAVDLWRQEFSSLAGVRSPHCVRVLSFERVDGRPALILEYVRGVSLAEWRRSEWGEYADAREILAQVHAGLRDLADQDSVHGDLSPKNVMIDDRGQIRLLDFGLANGSGERTRCTPEFAAPERTLGLPPDYRSDLYSLARLGQYLADDFDAGDLLSVEPERRTPPTEHSDPDRAVALGVKVNALLARAARGRDVQTAGLPANERARSASTFARALGVALVILALNLPSPHSVARPGFGTVTVTTESWCEVRADGHRLGFAPISFPVTTNELHEIECTGPRGPAVARVRVKAGERHRLRGRDFPH